MIISDKGRKAKSYKEHLKKEYRLASKESLKDKKAIIAGSWNTLGNVLIKGINYLTIPIFIRLMSSSEYGLYSTFISYTTIFSSTIGLGTTGIQQTAKYDMEGELESFLSFIIYLTACISALLCAILAIFHISIKDVNTLILVIVVIDGFLYAMKGMASCKFSAFFEYKKNIFISALNTLGNFALAIFFVKIVLFGDRFYARVSGNVLTNAVIFLIIFIDFRSKAKRSEIFGHGGRYLKYLTKLGLPLVFHILANSILASFDQIMIQNIVGSSAVAIYSFAYTFSAILLTLWTSIEPTWSAWAMEQLSNSQENRLKIVSIVLLSFIVACGIVIIGLGPEIVNFIGTPEYAEASYILGPLIISTLLITITNFYTQIEYFKRETRTMAFGTSLAAISNIILNHFCIKAYGYQAAAYTTAISYLIMFIIHFFTSRKLINIKTLYDESVFFILLGIAVMIAIISNIFSTFLFIRVVALIMALIIISLIIWSKGYLSNYKKVNEGEE